MIPIGDLISIRTYALENEKSCKGGLIQTLGNKRKISKKTRPYDGLRIDCVSPINVSDRQNESQCHHHPIT
jgi:hypothetical protein